MPGWRGGRRSVRACPVLAVRLGSDGRRPRARRRCDPDRREQSHAKRRSGRDAFTGRARRACLMSYAAMKRVFDVTIASMCLGLFGVPMVLIAVLIRIRMGPPVLY